MIYVFNSIALDEGNVTMAIPFRFYAISRYKLAVQRVKFGGFFPA